MQQIFVVDVWPGTESVKPEAAFNNCKEAHLSTKKHRSNQQHKQIQRYFSNRTGSCHRTSSVEENPGILAALHLSQVAGSKGSSWVHGSFPLGLHFSRLFHPPGQHGGNPSGCVNTSCNTTYKGCATSRHTATQLPWPSNRTISIRCLFQCSAAPGKGRCHLCCFLGSSTINKYVVDININC